MSEVIATLFLILIAVSMCVLVYVWLLDYMQKIMRIAERELEYFRRLIENSTRGVGGFVRIGRRVLLLGLHVLPRIGV